MWAFEEQARSLPTLVTQALGGPHKMVVAAKTAGQFQKVAKRLSLVAARRDVDQPVEIQMVPSSPEYERQDASYRGVSMGKRQRLSEHLFHRWRRRLGLGRAERSPETPQPGPDFVVATRLRVRSLPGNGSGELTQ